MDAYEQFLRAKIKLANFDGFDVPLEEINPELKPHTRAIVQWCVKGGNRAVFASFGLHKTATQIEKLRIIGKRTNRPGLITLPLGVRPEFFHEAAARFHGEYAVNLRFVRTTAEIDDERTIYLTNYESIREGKLDPNVCGQTSLDEASVLRSYGSKTYQEFLPLFSRVPFKFVDTATPAPNRYKELIHYAGYLGIMDTAQALTRFFQRDSTQANNLTLYPHKEEEFWLWVSSWALFIQRPSDLGFSDDGYILPPLDVRYHEIPSDYGAAGTEKDGQGLLFNDAAVGLQMASAEKRNSIPARVAKVAELVGEAPADHFVVWHDLEDERHAIQKAVPDAVSVWGSQDLEEREARIVGFGNGEGRVLSTKPVIAGSDRFTVANNDCVLEARRQPENNVDLVVTSIPFANHYEYTPSYNDFGHTESNDHFWEQMDFLTPELLRILKPGRMYCCHVKDRILFGNVTGAGAPTVSPFHAEAIFHAKKHGFDYMGMITVVTDVVRENNQTYRLSWTEQCKDGTKMGVGSPEYVLLFRKPQTDRSRGYADLPVKKEKSDYTRARWQVDAHAFWRSSGNRQLTAEELASLGPDKLAKAFTDYSMQTIYDYEFHIRIGEELEGRGALPSSFMSLAPGSHRDDVWHDINRMLTLNGEQAKRNVEQHVCPLQFDIVDRLIERYSNPGELVYDPFGGLMTVPYRAILKGRRGQASELNTGYFLDGLKYLRAAELEFGMPTLFDLEEIAA